MSWFIVILIVAIFWALAVTVLSGPDLRQFDLDVGEHFTDSPEDTAAIQHLLAQLQEVRQSAIKSKSLKKGLQLAREFADNLSVDLETDTQFIDVDIYGVAAQWAVAKGADPDRRILFLHGGAFVFGSARGHQKVSDRLSKIANASVLSVDYRMLPENSRKAGVLDAQHAYHWILNNGPNVKSTVDFLLLSGDSAGGNLALMLSSWSKRNASRRPDGIIAFSPSTDMTLASPTIKSNRGSDKMLGEGLGLISKIPQPIRAWVTLCALRTNPAHDLVSPTNRAASMGSEVTLQIWKDQVHDWHLFNMGYGSAEIAWKEVDKFIAKIERQGKT